MSGTDRRPEGQSWLAGVNGLRALATLGVFVTHFASMTAYADGRIVPSFTGQVGNFGLAMFFVISGLVLYRPFVQHRGDGHISWRAFWYRRVLRIVPAYWAALLILGPGNWRNFVFLQNYTQQYTGGLGVAWTLCIDASFYVLLPPLAAAIAVATGQTHGRRRPLRELALLGLLAAPAPLMHSSIWHVAAPHAILSLSLPAFSDWIALGMMLAVLSVWLQSPSTSPVVRKRAARRPWWPWLAALALAGLYLHAAPNPNLQPWIPYYGALPHLLAGLTAVCIVAPVILGAQHRGPVRLLSTTPLVWLGMISYSIYLWHKPLITQLLPLYNSLEQAIPQPPELALAVSAGLILLVTTGLAAASWYLIESPAMSARTHAALAPGGHRLDIRRVWRHLRNLLPRAERETGRHHRSAQHLTLSTSAAALPAAQHHPVADPSRSGS